MHSQSSIEALSFGTKQIIKTLSNNQEEGSIQNQHNEDVDKNIVGNLSSLSESLNEVDKANQGSKREGLSLMRHELTSLISVDMRIRQCLIMSREIEEFESRVQKVEEFIRNDDLVMLANLVVYQLSASMSLVRYMGKGKSTAANSGILSKRADKQVS